MKRETCERCVARADYIISSGSTVRETAAKFSISKSTVHKDVSERLRTLNPALCRQVRQVLEQNKAERHIRGGRATREKYRREQEKAFKDANF